MILLAVRDLAQGLWNLGSGYSVGRGFVTVDKMVISEQASGSVTALSFADGNIQDMDEKIREYLQAVDAWKEQ